MYCPHCGQQQASDEMRFCSRCGFPLGVIAQVLAQGGALATREEAGSQGQWMSPRQRGVRQGAMLMLSALMIVPLIVFAILLLDFNFLIPLIPLSAVVCVVGGFIRIAYALMFEAPAPPLAPTLFPAASNSFAPAQLNAPMRGAALPPAQPYQQQGTPLTDWRRPPQTAEIVHPPSVTENTTKLLERDREEQG